MIIIWWLGQDGKWKDQYQKLSIQEIQQKEYQNSGFPMSYFGQFNKCRE
jgi:hypothetical protein